MMGRRVIVAALVSGTALIMTGCGMQTEDMGFLYGPPYYAKLKVEVDTPEGIKSGYSVIEVTWEKSGRGFKVRGEAVAVDLLGGQVLFALLRSEASVDWAAYLHQNIDVTGLDGLAVEEQYRRIAAVPGVWPVKRNGRTAVNSDVDNYPYFVQFKDTNDPKSVEQVDPDDLAKSFGPGYRLKSLTLQMTDEPVTEAIEKRFGSDFFQKWADIYDAEWAKGKVNDNPYFNTLMGKLNAGDFRQGFKK